MTDRYEAARKALTHLTELVDVAKSVIEKIEASRSAESMDEVFDARDEADNVLSMFAYQPQHLDALRAFLAPDAEPIRSTITEFVLIENGEEMEWVDPVLEFVEEKDGYKIWNGYSNYWFAKGPGITHLIRVKE